MSARLTIVLLATAFGAPACDAPKNDGAPEIHQPSATAPGDSRADRNVINGTPPPRDLEDPSLTAQRAAQVHASPHDSDTGGILFERIRLVEDDSILLDEAETTNTALANTAVHPMSLPVDAASFQTGRRLHSDTRVEVFPDGTSRWVERILDLGPMPDHALTREASIPRPPVLATELERRLDEVGLADSDRVSAYINFLPAIRADAAYRVDWMHRRIKSLSRRKLLEEAEVQRGVEISQAVTQSLHRLAELVDCTVDGTTPAAHAAYVTCSASALRGLALHEEFVEQISVLVPSKLNSGSGTDYMANTGSQTLLFENEGYDGAIPTEGTSRPVVEVAVIDPAGFYRMVEHPAFLDSPGGISRIVKRMLCTASTCSTDSSNFGSFGGHGKDLIGAYQNINDGEDPNFTTPASRSDRSYGPDLVDLELYRWGSNVQPSVAITFAADPPGSDDGIDIIQDSEGDDTTSACENPDTTYGNMRDAWDFAYSHDAFGVISANNWVNRNDDLCTANGFATRPDLLVVGGFGDTQDTAVNGKAATPISGWVYDTQPLMGWHFTDFTQSDNCSSAQQGQTLCWSSARGGCRMRTGLGVIQSRSVVDIITPSSRQYSAQVGTNGSANYVVAGLGTSGAAPHAAAAAAYLKAWANASDFGAFQSPGIMHVNMLLMGDGTEGLHGTTVTGRESELDWFWGVGRMKMRLFNSVGLDGPAAWGTGSFWISDGQVIDVAIGSGPISSDVDYFVAAVSWDEPYINANITNQVAAKIELRIVRTNPTNGTCPNPNGGAATTIVAATSFDVHHIVRVLPEDADLLHGKCAWTRYSAVDISTAPDGFDHRLLFRADYWEDRDRESAENLDDIE